MLADRGRGRPTGVPPGHLRSFAEHVVHEVPQRQHEGEVEHHEGRGVGVQEARDAPPLAALVVGGEDDYPTLHEHDVPAAACLAVGALQASHLREAAPGARADVHQRQQALPKLVRVVHEAPRIARVQHRVALDGERQMGSVT